MSVWRSEMDGPWEAALAVAEGMGCEFPWEPTGAVARTAVDQGTTDADRWIALLRIEIRDCDACYGLCTVRPLTKAGYGAAEEPDRVGRADPMDPPPGSGAVGRRTAGG